MKKYILFPFSSLLLLLFLAVSCNKKEDKPYDIQENTSNYPNTQTYKSDSIALDLIKSSIQWSGKKMFENEGHNGTIGIKSAYMLLDTSGNIHGGKILIDMNKIVCMDESSPKLIKHLKSKDFFDVTKYPTASYEITENRDTVLLGNLTICNKTLPYQAKYTFIDGSLKGILEFDRQKFGINYHSPDGLIFEKLGKKLKESLISDKIEIQFELIPKN